MKSNVQGCRMIELPKIQDLAGSITVIDNEEGILPFEVKRVFYIYDVPGGESRGAHAHKACHEILIAASGAFEVFLDDGSQKRQVQMNRPYYGLHVPPGIWAQEVNFSSGAICLVLASDTYSKKGYVRDYENFKKLKEEVNGG